MLFVGTSIIHPSTEGVFLLCNILDLLIYSNNNVNYVEPDISIICDKNKLDDKGCNGAPDWIIEIVSPSSKRMDYYIKLFKYRTAGVREYWIVDPIREMILVYDFENDDYEQYSFSEIVKVRIYDDFEINFTTI